jgi:tyrosine-protein kinase Etk/Wzc
MMRANTYATPDDIDVASVGNALKRSLKKTLIISALAGIATFLVLSMMAPRYGSEAHLSIVARGAANPFSAPRTDGSSSDTVNVRMDKEAINTHVRALTSPDLILPIAKELKLAERPEFNREAGPVDMLDRLKRMIGMGGKVKGQSVEDRVLNAFVDKLSVYSPKESRIIVIRFESTDPKLAATIANKLANEYRKSLANRTVVETTGVQEALLPEIDRLMKEAGEAQSAVEKFRGEANIFKGGRESTGLNEQQLGELTAELTRAKADRSSAEARIRSAREMLRGGTADALPDVQRSPLIQNIVQQRVRVERQVSELSATLLPGHPRMQQLTADLRGLKRQIQSEVAKVVDSLDKEAKVAALREASITKSLDELKAKIVTTGPDEVKLRNLEATARSKRAELERLQAQYEANRARAESRAVPVEAQIITRARVASVASAPKKMQYTLLVTFGTLLIGVALSILGAFWTGARANAPVPMAGRGPTGTSSMSSPSLSGTSHRGVAAAAAASNVASPLDLSIDSNEAAVSLAEPFKDSTPSVVDHSSIDPEAISSETAASSIADVADQLEQAKGVSGLRSLITSDVVNVDARKEATDLAAALAKRGASVVIVDWAFDGGGLAKTYGVKAAPGLTELVTAEATFQDAIQAVPGGELHVICAGAAPPQLDDVMDPDRLNLVLDALDEAYEHIIVVGENSDARQLFEVIEGRFDAGITVCEPKGRVNVIQDPPGTFLGYQVADIALITLERELTDELVPGRSLMRSMRSKLDAPQPSA